MMRKSLLISLVASIALCQTNGTPRAGTFEGEDATILSHGCLELTVPTQGSVIANIVMTDKSERLSPLWNPLRLARESGRDPQFTGVFGHFVCVDGLGQPSAEERAAGLPQHSEAHVTRFAVNKDVGGNSVSLSATLPIVQETFSRSFHMAPDENIIYVDSQLENLMGFDRPVNWAEHATIAAPFLAPGQTTVFLSGTRSQNRDYLANQLGRGGAAAGRQRRERRSRRQRSRHAKASGFRQKFYVAHI
jgi:hypothetical protein